MEIAYGESNGYVNNDVTAVTWPWIAGLQRRHWTDLVCLLLLIAQWLQVLRWLAVLAGIWVNVQFLVVSDAETIDEADRRHKPTQEHPTTEPTRHINFNQYAPP